MKDKLSVAQSSISASPEKSFKFEEESTFTFEGRDGRRTGRLEGMITVVSGIPRSGTSLMMQMLAAGGMAVLTDGQRTPDLNNPRGYYELELVKSLARHPDVISQADGKVVKVISPLLTSLPSGREYRIIFMQRPLAEIVASQDRMLERLGKQVPAAPKESVISAFERHLTQVRNWISAQPGVSALYVDYAALIADAHREASRISAFLAADLDIAMMAGKVEQSLYRERVRS